MHNYKIVVNQDILKKYDCAAPRYTSYPTAPCFKTDLLPEEYIRHMMKADDSTMNAISLYFHLPFCDTLCYYCGCNMLVTRNRHKIDRYIDYLEKEIVLLKKHIQSTKQVVQLHWGGGTPTHLDPDQIMRLGKIIRNHFEFASDAEIGVEIDPRELTREHINALREIKFNRCSIGVQDYTEKVQKAINRVQSESVTNRAVSWARQSGFKSVNLDLMYGLPYQTTASFNHTLDKILKLEPDRLAVFNYAHLPGLIKHQKRIKDEWIPLPEDKLALLKLTIEKLTGAGYVYIGMDHFARPDDELAIAMKDDTLYRNFQGYSTHAGADLFAFGISGISMLLGLYVQNYKKLSDYYSRLDDGVLPIKSGIELSWDDRLRREVIVRLMCRFRIVKRQIEQQYNIVFDRYFADALLKLKDFQEDGLVILSDGQIEVTLAGRMVIRNIAMNFDAYLNSDSEKKPRYSRTV
jgi:oxygen-independent coproporphyrinogen III oxidase